MLIVNVHAESFYMCVNKETYLFHLTMTDQCCDRTFKTVWRSVVSAFDWAHVMH